MNTDIGKKVKLLRKKQGLTLKQVNEVTALSTGFLSQLERGKTTIAIDSLEKISSALEVNLSYFIQTDPETQKDLTHTYEQQILQVEKGNFVHYLLSGNIENLQLLPRIIQIMPSTETAPIEPYQHEGEEFIYVLEGILTLILDGKQTDLHPGDSAHYLSTRPHNWANRTNMQLRLLTINIPNNLTIKEN